MSILLPITPGIRSGKPSLLDFGGVLVPPGGGVAQQLLRPSRWSLEATLPSSSSLDVGRVFVARLIRAKVQGAIFAFPQDFANQATGTPVVDGAGQTGSTLNLRGFDPDVWIREGQFFPLNFGGRNYLHMAGADIQVGDNGKVALPIAPMLRVIPNDGASCNFAQPVIEGYLSGNAVQWDIQTAAFVDITFTITEWA